MRASKAAGHGELTDHKLRNLAFEGQGREASKVVVFDECNREMLEAVGIDTGRDISEIILEVAAHPEVGFSKFTEAYPEIPAGVIMNHFISTFTNGNAVDRFLDKIEKGEPTGSIEAHFEIIIEGLEEIGSTHNPIYERFLVEEFTKTAQRLQRFADLGGADMERVDGVYQKTEAAKIAAVATAFRRAADAYEQMLKRGY